MKKSTIINLGGIEFYFYDDAVALTEKYLHSLQEAFEKSHIESSNELVADLEGRMAEILAETHNRKEYVVTVEDIEQIIDRMGEPEEIIDVEEETETIGNPRSGDKERVTHEKIKETVVPPPYVTPPPIKKKFYRSVDDSEIGGVCGGIAAYFNIDSTWVRLATVLLTLITFSNLIFVYIVIWIITKPANTPYRVMQLHGVSPTLENIGKYVNKSFNKVSQTFKKSREAQYEPFENLTRSKSEKRADKLVGILTIIAKVFMVLIAVPLCLTFMALLITLVVIPIAYIVEYEGASLFFNTYFPDAVQLRLTLVFLFFAAVSATIVVMVLLYLIYSAVIKRVTPSPKAKKWWTIAWIVTTAIALVLATVIAGIYGENGWVLNLADSNVCNYTRILLH